MKKTRLAATSFITLLAVSFTSIAGSWCSDANGWWYDEGNGSYPKNTWSWIDSNNDGVAECYYFDENGYMASNKDVDGSWVNADGQWVDANGTVRTKNVNDSLNTAAVQETANQQNKHHYGTTIQFDPNMSVEEFNRLVEEESKLMYDGQPHENWRYYVINMPNYQEILEKHESDGAHVYWDGEKIEVEWPNGDSSKTIGGRQIISDDGSSDSTVTISYSNNNYSSTEGNNDKSDSNSTNKKSSQEKTSKTSERPDYDDDDWRKYIDEDASNYEMFVKAEEKGFHVFYNGKLHVVMYEKTKSQKKEEKQQKLAFIDERKDSRLDFVDEFISKHDSDDINYSILEDLDEDEIYSNLKKYDSNHDLSRTYDGYETLQAMIDCVNVLRKKKGLNELEMDETLMKAAAIRADELFIRYAHTRPDGSSCFTAISDITNEKIYVTTSRGENAACGQNSALHVTSAWYHSKGHRKNMLNSGYRYIGVGHSYINGEDYWIQMFSS